MSWSPYNIALTLSGILEGKGYQVEQASPVHEALAKIEREQFDLLLLDLRVPDGDGLSALRRVKETWPGSDNPSLLAASTLTPPFGWPPRSPRCAMAIRPQRYSLLIPINHASSKDGVNRYKLEPYVAVADVYAGVPHVGRGGWTWYPGSACWMYRV